jgi:RimJ/RimL family protein N-acetyltransferase
MITSKRIKLRAIEESDATAYFNWINDPETNFWRGLYPPISTDNALAEIKVLKQNDSTKFTLSIVDSDEKLIGIVGLRRICTRSRRAEIWIYIGEKNFWSKGYGQEALSSLVDYGFDEMNLHRIWLECNPEFTQAVRCYEKVGFEKEGILKDGYYRRGQYRDTMMMGLIRKHGRVSK